MKNAAFALLVAIGLAAPGLAQQARVGDNINVLPVPDRTDELDFLRGDLYGQRQNEPSVAVSTVNKDHIVAFYNDFRAVDVPDDPPIPGLLARVGLEPAWNGLRRLFARVLALPAPREGPAPPYWAGTEAGIGMSVSYDGGLTWTGGFVPGLPFDTSPASLASPAHALGLQGMSDPVVVAAPCGRFYLAYLGFTRGSGGDSSLLLSVFQDGNDSDVDHTLRLLATTEIERGQNGEFGHFVDKPDVAIRPTGEAACTAVTEEVYVTYTTFVGKGKGGKFQSKINFAKSVDGGASFTVTKVDDNFTESSGTSLVVDPAPGSKTLFVFWRSFNTPDTIVLRKSTDGGRRWSKPVDLLAGDLPMATFDQPTVSTLDAPVGSVSIRDELAFRSNAFPTAAATPDGSTLLVAWQERVDEAGRPDPAGAPRIVLLASTDGGATWTGPDGTPGRKAVAGVGPNPAEPVGLGFFRPDASPVGPQLMPSLGCGAGAPNRCLLAYYESRDPNLAPNGWVGGYDRVLDLRGVLVDAGPSGVAVGPSFQISRYSYRALLLGEEPEDELSFVETICQPGGTNCVPALNYAGYPHTGGGSSPFLGDYNDVAAMTTYVKDGPGDPWRIAALATDVPFGAAFLAAWADNRNVVRPAPGDGTEWQNFDVYGPAGLGGSCINPGSRDENVLTAAVSLGLLVTAPTNFKPFPPTNGETQIEFPMTVWNNTGQDRQFELAIVGSPSASFAKEPSPDGSFAFPLQDGAVTVFAYSSVSIDVFAFDGDPVRVEVTECDLGTCGPVASPLTGSITFNAPASIPPAGAPVPTFTSSAIAVNPVPRNPVPRNPVPRNPVPRNPVPRNTATGEPVTVFDVVDYSWVVTPASADDAGAYLALANIDRAFQDDYIFQIFVTKPSTLFTVAGCDPANLALGTLVGHISDPQNPVPRNPVPRNPVPRNPVPRNAPLSDTLVQNTTFTLASNADAGTAGALAAFSAASAAGCDPATGAGLIGACTLAAPRRPNEVTVTVRAYQITENPARRWDPFGDAGAPTTPSVTVADYWCSSADEGCPFAQDGPELAVAADAAGVDPTTVPAGGTVRFPLAPVSVANVGNQPARDHRIGYYLSAAESVGALPRKGDGTIDTTSTAVETRLLASVPAGALAPGGGESIDPLSLTIPVDIPRPDNGEGTYFLYAYVDDERVVSELDEENNFVQGGPITVVAPGYSGILGLFTPCDGATCTKKAGPALPLAFQLTPDGATPADSTATPPRLTIFAPTASGACETDTSVTPLFVAEPDDVASGASGWQFFDASCQPVGPTACSRDAFTYQYNWQTKDPATGADLPAGCYTVAIEVEATGQLVGAGSGPVATVEVTLTN